MKVRHFAKGSPALRQRVNTMIFNADIEKFVTSRKRNILESLCGTLKGEDLHYE
jgi:hypothetical protein